MGFTLVNDVTATVATQSNSGTTSLVVGTGLGAQFASATTANPIRCGAFDSTGALKFYFDVTARSTDTLTVANRGAESTTDVNILTTDVIAAVVTASLATDYLRARSVSDTHADTSAVNTTSVVTVATQAVPTTVQPGDIVRFVAVGDLLNNSGGTITYFGPSLALGATTVASLSSIAIATNASRRYWKIVADILVVATNDQRVSSQYFLSGVKASGSTWSSGSLSVSGDDARIGTTEDLTAGKSITVTVSMGTANAAADFVCHESWLELIRR